MSAAADGRIPWVSVDDIADVAFAALTDEKSHNRDHIIVGPELLTYDGVSFFFFPFAPHTVIMLKLIML